MKRRYIILILGIGAILLLMIGEDREPTAQNKNSYVTQDINTFKYLGELNTEDDFKIAARYDLLILNEGEAVPEKISKIRSYNPNVKIILYTMSEDLPNPNHPFFREHPEIHPSLQKMYEDINKNHPEYFLLDSNGKRIYLWVYDQMFKEHYPNTEEKPGHCLDPRTGWANYYKDYVLNSIARGIYDGVYSDAAMSYEEMKDEGNIKYWKVDNGPEEWNQAVHKMLKGIEDSLGEDAITIYNNGYNLWIDVYDGRLFEWFLSNWDYATLGGEQWLLHIQSAKETVESGKMLFAMQYGNTDEDRMYGLTSFLLIANDKSYYSFNEQSVDDQTPWLWYPEYETEIGKPLEDYYVRDSVYQRDFTKGKVLVNPSSKTINVKFTKEYKTLDGKIADEIILKSKTGIILLRTMPSNETHDIKTCLYYFGKLQNADDKTFKTIARYDMFMLPDQNTDPETIKKIRSYNPDQKILYFTMGTVLPNPRHKYMNPDVYPPLQELFWYAKENHPEWFIRDVNGNYVGPEFTIVEGEPFFVVIDPSSSYADYFAEQLKKWVRDEYDGVYLDVTMHYEEMKDVTSHVKLQNDPGRSKWDAGVKKILGSLYGRIGKNGIVVTNTAFNDYLDVESGHLHEWFIQYEGDEVLGGSNWLSHIRLAKETVDRGKILVVNHYGETEEHRMYGLTSFLLIAGENSYYFYNKNSIAQSDWNFPLVWYPEYEAPIGSPLGDYYKKEGIYQRDFTNGKVLVNPSGREIKIKLDRTYYTLNLREVNEITLEPKTEMILLVRKYENRN